MQGAWVLDLFAGSGRLGMEALRRGAARVVFVERDPKLAETIRRHLIRAELTGQAEVWRRDALAAVRDLGSASRRFDLILLDPPYGEGWITRMLQAVVERGILGPGGAIVAEGHWRDRPAEVRGLRVRREARYGETALWYVERSEGSTDI